MAPLRTLVLPAFAAVAAAQNIADFVPECGTSCIDTTVDENTTCEAGDAACICENAYSVKRNAEVCLRDECSESDYGKLSSPTHPPLYKWTWRLTRYRPRHDWLR